VANEIMGGRVALPVSTFTLPSQQQLRKLAHKSNLGAKEARIREHFSKSISAKALLRRHFSEGTEKTARQEQLILAAVFIWTKYLVKKGWLLINQVHTLA
jgi:hypothetical protein